jgi:1-acyl-sn-glycerol-3-phosphate acyltransferase
LARACSILLFECLVAYSFLRKAVFLTAMSERSGPATPIKSEISPWLPPILYPVGHHLLHWYFADVQINGQALIPKTGPVILAPTHRSRWDALIVPYVSGFPVTGRHLHYMVSHDEMQGFQGWVIRHFGGFAVNTRQPSIATLRYGVELLVNGEALVIFPEGNIFREPEPQPLKPGLARLAIQATLAREQAGLAPDLKILPISLHYSRSYPQRGDQIRVDIGQPLSIENYNYHQVKQTAQQLTTDLYESLEQLQRPSLVMDQPALLSV